MITASVGVGTSDNAYRAGTEAVEQALLKLLLPSSQKVSVAFVFGSVGYDQDQLILGINSALPGVLVVGCSSAGEISTEGLSTEGSVVVLLISSDQMEFFGTIAHHLLWNAKQSGEECSNTLLYNSHGYVSSVWYFIDALSGNSDAVTSGAFERLPPKTPIHVACAGDDLLFYQTYEYFNDKAYSGSVVGLGLSGNYHEASIIVHGYLPIGIEHHVTKSDGAILHELDGKPAASIYEDYFGQDYFAELHRGLLPSLAVGYPLGLFTDDDDTVIIRNPIIVGKKGEMTCMGDIPQGAQLRLMVSDATRGIEVAKQAAEAIMKKLDGRKPKAVMMLSSVARKKMLGSQVNEEIEAVQQVVGRDVPIVGFYSYGQMQGNTGERIPLQNASLLIWALAE